MTNVVRLYHVVAVGELTGTVTCMTRHPVAHGEACTIKKSLMTHPARRLELREVNNGQGG